MLLAYWLKDASNCDVFREYETMPFPDRTILLRDNVFKLVVSSLHRGFRLTGV